MNWSSVARNLEVNSGGVDSRLCSREERDLLVQHGATHVSMGVRLLMVQVPIPAQLQ